jgi:RNA polymerase sigma factor (sigma-70 family)
MTRDEQAALVARAQDGDREALAALVEVAQPLVYNLAVRMVADPTDAQDLTQEILIRVVTHLAGFRGDSAFTTWVYRVASNHLLTARRRAAEHHIDSLDAARDTLAAGMADALAAGDAPLEDQVLVREAKLTCTSRMLLGLDRDHRLAFILGEILELSGEEAAEVLDIDPAAFRKRLSRARERMAAFTAATCGVVDPANDCRCAMQAARLVRAGALDRDRLCWTVHPVERAPVPVDEIEGIERALALFRSHPSYRAPGALVEGLREVIQRSAFAAATGAKSNPFGK